MDSLDPHAQNVEPRAYRRGIAIGAALMAGILLLLCIFVAFSSHAGGNGNAAASLSDDPVSACNGVYNKLWPDAPGTLSVQVGGQAVTHFYANGTLQLTYTGTQGDSFAVSTPSDISFMPTSVSIEAIPYFDGAVQTSDATSATFPITASDIHGNTLTLSVQFPFTHPNPTPDNTLLQTGGTPYTRPGPYCFDVNIPYVRPDGEQDVGAAFIGLYEEPASTSAISHVDSLGA